jgi:Spy/CpxP family protein refolding chaperone
MIVKSLGALALLAAATLPAAAAAQDAPPPAAHGHRFGGPDMAGRFQEREARHIKALHDLLEIRSDQEAAFQAFATALKRQPSEKPPEAAAPDGMGALTTPERLDRIAKMMADREARRRERFDRVSGAVKSLYAALSPEQKRAFDALPALVGPGFGLGGHMGHGGHMMADGMGRMGGRDGGRPMGPPPNE